MSYAARKVCSEAECIHYFINDKWGRIRAHSVGWYQSKNDDAWCPDHIPKEIKVWRARNRGQNVE